MSIQISNLSRAFAGRQLFQTSNIAAPTQGLLALLGPNGSGKTTLLRILSTLTTPTHGDALVAGFSIVKEPKQVRKNMGFVPTTDGGMFTKLTGLENLLLFGRLRGLRRREVFHQLELWNEILGLETALTTRFGICSSGMRQKLSIARALLHNPKVLLLDEPLRSLDQATTTRVLDAFRKIATEKLVVFTSHTSNTAELADHSWEIFEETLRPCS